MGNHDYQNKVKKDGEMEQRLRISGEYMLQGLTSIGETEYEEVFET